MVIAFLGKEREQATVTKVLTAAAEMLELFITDEAVEKRYFEFLVSMAAGIEQNSLRGIVVDHVLGFLSDHKLAKAWFDAGKVDFSACLSDSKTVHQMNKVQRYRALRMIYASG